MPRRRKKTLVEALAETQALHARRDVSKRRLAAAKRAALAPRPPANAIERFQSVMRTYANKVERQVERRVLARLPVLGSGDELNVPALEAGLAELQNDLNALANQLREPALRSAKRVSEHGRKEVSRMLQVVVPPNPHSALVDAEHAQNTVLRMLAAGDAQIAQIRKSIAGYVEGASMRETIKQGLWVSRNRSAFIARDESYKLHRKTVADWAQRTGSTHGIYVTARDERVRETHKANDGKVFRWDEPPTTLSEPNCRCRMLPVEATI